ncbi:hypothetical protein BDQ17DRAFT_1332633 [Cyathus striatus]|nr:hypothetical protein BDQ17DRAFT_1332633 [Cyathus striatus]
MLWLPALITPMSGLLVSAAIYELVQNSSGSNFFDDWDVISEYMINGSVSRNSVKIMTKTAFPMGSVWLIDIFHIPYGSVGSYEAIWCTTINAGFPSHGPDFNNRGGSVYWIISNNCSVMRHTGP